MRLAFLILGCCGLAAAQQPVIAPGGVLNAASNAFAGLPNAALARGSMFLIFGSNLGPARLVQVDRYPLPTELAGTSVTAIAGGQSIPCLMVYTSAGQIAAILPSRAPTGSAQIVVRYNGEAGLAARVDIAEAGFGIFAVNQAGSGAGIITNAAFAVYSFTQPARPAETAILWGTGLGAVPGDEAAGPLPGDQTTIPVEVLVAGRPAAVRYRGRSGCCAGLDQIVFDIPAGTEGCQVPVAVRARGVVSNYVTLAVSSRAGICGELLGLGETGTADFLRRGTLALGAVTLVRDSLTTADNAFQVTDLGQASFARYGSVPSAVGNLLPQPPAGSCIVYQYRGTRAAPPAAPPAPTFLDAGQAITVSGPSGGRSLTPDSLGQYSALFATSGTNNPGVLVPGDFTVSGGGGPGVSNFLGRVSVNFDLVWTNRDRAASIPRDQPLTLTWLGGNPNTDVGILGYSTAVQGNGALFTCSARNRDGQFTIPTAVLQALPPTNANEEGTGFLAISSEMPTSRFSAPELNAGLIVALHRIGRASVYR